MVIETLREQWARVAELDKEIGVIERRIKLWHRSNAASRKIAEIPGVGVLSATAVVAAMGDPAAFRSGREFAAWLGLVPRHSGTGGRVRMLGISKRGDRYLRTLLIHGARAVLTLHSDRGAPMTSKCTAQLLADLGVTRSLSRPQVSDDNPFSEAQFKTLKYHPGFPGRFHDITAAIAFCRTFFPWYNTEQ